MLSQLCVLVGLAGVMALPKIEHRAESAPSESGWSKYYDRFQDYVKNNQAVNTPESPISQDQIQSDSQYNGGMPNYSQLQGYQGQYGNNQQYQQQMEYFKKCMEPYNIPQMPLQGEANAASPASSGYNNQQWDEAWKSCSQNFQNIPGASSFSQGLPQFPGGSSSATSG